MNKPGDISFAMQLGSIAVSWNAEGVSWSPDVADDLVTRSIYAIKELMAEAAAYGLLLTENEVLFDDGSLAEQTTGEDDDGE